MNLVIFLFLYVLPFVYQLVIYDGPNHLIDYKSQIYFCNFVCMATACYFELIELF